MRQLLEEFGYSFTSPSTLLVDNQSAIDVAKNPEHHGRMKHLDCKWYWLRREIELGTMTPKHIPGVDNIADIMTKELPRVKVSTFREGMGVVKRNT